MSWKFNVVIFGDTENNKNSELEFKNLSWDDLLFLINISFKNEYDVLVQKVE